MGLFLPTSAGSYDVEARVTDKSGATTSTILNLNVVPEPSMVLLVGLGLAGLATKRSRN